MKINLLARLRWRVVLALAIVGTSSTSCDKFDPLEESHLTSSSQASAVGRAINGSIPCYMFDWEATTYLPSAPTSGANPVQMPWNSGMTGSIDPNLLHDYKAADGWQLMYNTFTPTTQLNDPGYFYFFALYNRFRGQLRFYIWKNSTALATTHVNHGLQLYTPALGATSTLLNYNAVDIIPRGNQSGFSTVLNQQLGLAGGTWLVMQYETAYDPNLQNIPSNSLQLRWKADWVSVSQVKLNGTSSGTVKGYLGNPNQPDFNGVDYFSSFIQKGVFSIFGAAATGQVLDAISGNSAFQTALTNAQNDLVKGFFSGIIGGITGTNSSSAQPINLTINSKIEMSGTITSNGNISDRRLTLPGQPDSQTGIGNLPGTSNPMGVFTLSNTPTINIRVLNQYQAGPFEDPQYGDYYEDMQEDQFTLDNNSFNIVWNPAVINTSSTGASIQNLKKEVIVLGPKENGGFVPVQNPMCNCGGKSPYIMVPRNHGTIEQVGHFPVAASEQSVPLLLDYARDVAGVSNDQLAMRVSFDVVPNNGITPKTKIVKTFYANASR